MSRFVTLLRIAGFVQIGISAANLYLPRKLRYQENLERVTPIIRQIFFVHSAYVVGVVLLFAGISFGFASELTSGHGLGRFLAGAMAVFWLARAPVQLLYYDASLRRSNRIGDVAFTAAAIFLAMTYGAAAIVSHA
ncbi:MAG TPA: hypothetical protein VFN26_09185 [Candidatus Acidoferrum sp.]|nr:hypothetical protein [Candidatus Acidoferrum sp.]